MKKLLNLLSMVLMLIGVMSSPIEASADEIEKVLPYYEFVVEGVENYYRNKDLGENNDITVYFSDEILPLLNAKIEMDTFQRKAYGLEYKDYEIQINPILKDSWSEKDGQHSLTIQVIRIWYYSDEPTKISEVLDITVIGNKEYMISECYESYESLTYGPIDEVYQNALNARSTTSVETVLSSYISDFKDMCIEKESYMEEEKRMSEENSIKVLSQTSFHELPMLMIVQILYLMHY